MIFVLFWFSLFALFVATCKGTPEMIICNTSDDYFGTLTLRNFSKMPH